jgi:hypothetical protein
MADEEKYTKLIDEIKILYTEHLNKQNILRLDREKKFSIFCNELQDLYEQEKEKIYDVYVRPFVNQYSFLQEASSLEVIGKLKYETYHSLFLKYIWSCQNPFGAQILKDFLITIGQEKKWLNTLFCRNYEGCIEERTKALRKGNDKKRIDLLFVDKKNEWCIVIENKIDSEVHYSGSQKRSQLDFYYSHCEKTYMGYNKLYILLSYNNKNTSHVKGNWIYADYCTVFKSLLKYHAKDDLIRDYLKSLFKLLFSNDIMLNNEYNTLYRGMQFYNNIISNIK